MLNPLTNDEDEIYLKKEGIDRGVGYLVLGIIVLMIFLLAIVGMGRIQKITDPTTPSNRYAGEREKVSEIGGADNVGTKD